MRRICVVTGTRADYGLLRWVMQGVAASDVLDLQVAATGMHLSPEYGLTWQEIQADGFRIDEQVEMLVSSDSPVGIAKSIGLGTIGFADAFSRLRPDLIVILGDRFEVLAAASAALPARIPIAHLHGGETTEGAFDDSIRHAITKMAHLHFVAAEPYRQRVIQLGEDPERVFLVGGLGADALLHQPLLDREELQRSLGVQLRDKSLLVTFHPATLESSAAEVQFSELLEALNPLDDTTLIFTMPNADTEGRVLMQMVTRFVDDHPNAHVFTSLGNLRYLSCVSHVDAVVGNSSSGLTEAPSLRKGTINVGDRQKGRLRASSVIDCAADAEEITNALAKLYSPEFQSALTGVDNPYDGGGASQEIVRVLQEVNLEGITQKHFHDVRAL
jgi:GDP/UDP-N,N'-diacetylbacillosamine 2-epimerase (hydrolysing)